MPPSNISNKRVQSGDNILDKLSHDISSEVGNMHEDELESISGSFDASLNKALKQFNSNAFDDDGFVKRMRDLELPEKNGDVVKNVLNNIRNDYVAADTYNYNELLLRRDIYNICTQMPEMRDVIHVIRDAIIESNVASGEISRSIVFENHEDNEGLQYQVQELETRFKLSNAIKNYITINTLMYGEYYVQVTPYSKLFAELEVINGKKTNKSGKAYKEQVSIELNTPSTLYTESNLDFIMAATSVSTKRDTVDTYCIEKGSQVKVSTDRVNREEMSALLKNIEVHKTESTMLTELGEAGFKEFLLSEYKEAAKYSHHSDDKSFQEAIGFNKVTTGVYNEIDQDVVDNVDSYSHIKGVYIRYLDGKRLIPIRIDRRIVGYFYISTTMDLQTNPGQPKGMVDLSYQSYTRDKKIVDGLANIIIKSFDKSMLEKNIKLKNEIVDIIMAHKFSEGKLSFIYIPETEIVRFVVNEDENGRGHSAIEPSLFPARMYLMLTMYNMLYTLNNNTTRVHYLRSSGLNKNYASQIQRTMRKFQSRRITIDDIYSYSGVLNKVGGMGEMILPTGKNDYKALETDTIAAAENPFNLEFMEQRRREAISGTGVPHLMMINAIDEADFAKTLEMANTRFQSTAASYKIDLSDGITQLYRVILKYCTDLEDDIVHSFKFLFNESKQPELVVTNDMIQNFNTKVELVESLYYSKQALEDESGNPTPTRMFLRREMAKRDLPQLDFDELDEIIKRVEVQSVDDKLQKNVSKFTIEDQDLDEVKSDNQ